MIAEGGSRLGLGTAQFGMAYGITNRLGQVSAEEVRAILARARQHGIRLVDTAHLYGESEAVLGACLDGEDSFEIVTKTPKFAGRGDGAATGAELERALAESLAQLGRERIHALLVHDGGDLLGPCGPELWQAMERLRAAGRVGMIGASVYTGEEVDAILARYSVDIVQVPFNAIDRRLVAGGQLRRLAERGVEVHARSLFLQGLLLQAPETIAPEFGELRQAIATMHTDFRRAGLTPLEGALTAAFQCREISRFIVGVCSQTELAAICAAEETASAHQGHFSYERWRVADERLVNPVHWPELSATGAGR